MDYIDELELPAHDPYDSMESDDFKYWQGRDQIYRVSKMKESHIRNCINLCKKLARSSSFSSEEEKWADWVSIFESELRSRPKEKTSNQKRATGKRLCKTIKRSFKEGLITTGQVNMRCACGKEYIAKAADLKRGWGLSCSKRCSAIRRKYGAPAAEIIRDQPKPQSKEVAINTHDLNSMIGLSST